jgi:hypothetical protein
MRVSLTLVGGINIGVVIHEGIADLTENAIVATMPAKDQNSLRWTLQQLRRLGLDQFDDAIYNVWQSQGIWNICLKTRGNPERAAFARGMLCGFNRRRQSKNRRRRLTYAYV